MSANLARWNWWPGVGPPSAAVLAACIWICMGPAWLPAQEADWGTRFEREIRPLLARRCGQCHGPQEHHGGLRLDARSFAFRGGDGGPVLFPGQADQSELVRRIASDDPDQRMPPETEALPDAEINLLRRWINDGATWIETEQDRQALLDPRRHHWSFQPPREIAPPSPPSAANAVNAIDCFLLVELQRHGLGFSPTASRGTLIRRLYLDLLGLPPSPEEIEAFLADRRPAAYERLVDRLLASPRYGERWGQHWLDVVRYADTHGFEVNTPREHAWPYRDYVIQSLNHDKAYDRFVREQLAGDALHADPATGFLVASAVLLPGQIGADDQSKRLARQDELDEIIQGVSATMLGLTLGCARCHDHKFDPLTARDYYAMQAFFAGVQYGDRPIHDAEHQDRLRRAEALTRRIEEAEQRLATYQPLAATQVTVIIDEQDKQRTQQLKPPNGPGANPAGTQRGYRDDVGDERRLGNLSGGQYTWWDNHPGEDVLAYAPQLDGDYRLWISWGVHGSGVHTRDARYILDRDGDLQTRDDQQELASVDQYYPAGVTAGETEHQPLWSGLLDLGVVSWTPTARLLVRGGETGSGITADVIVLQATTATGAGRPLPRLRGPINAQRNLEKFPPAAARFIRFTSWETIDDNRHEPCLDELEVFGPAQPAVNLALASRGSIPTSSGNYSDVGRHRLAHVNDGQYGNEQSWISNERGKGWVQIELPEPSEVDRIVWGRDRNGKFRDRLAVRYRIDVSLDGKQWRHVAGHDDRLPPGTPHDPVLDLLRNAPPDTPDDLRRLTSQVTDWRAQQEKLRQPRMVYAGVFGQPAETHVLRRGDPEQPLQPIAPAIPQVFLSGAATATGEHERDSDSSPAALASDEQQVPASHYATANDEQQRRLALADWIASPANPLTARVMANRLWHHHFGQGLVTTPSDFGVNGAAPSHPELLDWLAGQLVKQDWSLKSLHRLIVCSAAYRQAQRFDDHAASIDRDNRLLWTFAGRRLEAEVIRDMMLNASGELNLKAGGPGFNFFQSRGGLNGFPPVEEFSAEGFRRMVYAHKVRMERVPVFGAFDCPDAGQAMPARGQSTTAIQALNLFNSPFVIERSQRFAERLQTASGDAARGGTCSPAECVRRAFQIALGRPPTEVEHQAALNTVAEHGLPTLCRALLNSNEFLFLP